MFWGAIDGPVADAWFPLPPGLSSLPGAAAVTTNANPRPANAISLPGGFNLTAPDLTALFASLPTTTAAIPRATISPTQIVLPWNEAIALRGGVSLGAKFNTTMPLPVVEIGGGVRVGAGEGVPDSPWGPNIIEPFHEGPEEVHVAFPSPVNGYYRRRILQATYSAAEMSAACNGATSATINGIRFYVYDAPPNQPFPDYTIGAKNTTNAVGVDSSSTNGGTFTQVYTSANQTFTSESMNEFMFDTPITWTGGNFALVWAWCRAGDPFEDPGQFVFGTMLFGSGSMYHAESDDEGCYTITSAAEETTQYVDEYETLEWGRPVIQLFCT